LDGGWGAVAMWVKDVAASVYHYGNLRTHFSRVHGWSIGTKQEISFSAPFTSSQQPASRPCTFRVFHFHFFPIISLSLKSLGCSISLSPTDRSSAPFLESERK
jgi:hypothetical protein